MANIKSAKKRVLVAQTKTERNKAIRSKVKTMIKKVDAAIAAGDKAAAQASLLVAISEIDKAASKGIIHKNQASNRKSGVMALANTVVTAEDIAAAPKREKKVAAPKGGTKKAAAKAAKKEAYKAADAEKAKRREATLKAEKKAHDAKAKAEAEAAAAEAAEATEE